MQHTYRMWLGELEMTVHVVQIEDAMPSLVWMTARPIIVRATVEVSDPSAGSEAVRVVHVQDYAVDVWDGGTTWTIAEKISFRALQSSMEQIEPVISGEEW